MFDSIKNAAQGLLGAVAEGNDADGAKLTAATQEFNAQVEALETEHTAAAEANAAALATANEATATAEAALETAREANAAQVEELNARATAAEDSLAEATETIEAKDAELATAATTVSELTEANQTLSEASVKAKEDLDAVKASEGKKLTPQESYKARLAANTKKEN